MRSTLCGCLRGELVSSRYTHKREEVVRLTDGDALSVLIERLTVAEEENHKPVADRGHLKREDHDDADG